MAKRIISVSDFARARRRNMAAASRDATRWNTREYDAAKQTELLSYWKTEPVLADYDIFNSLSILQTRARTEFQNNDYIKRFVNLSKQNIIGHEGIKLRPAARNRRGSLDRGANEALTFAWNGFCRKGRCEVTKRHTMVDLQNMAIAGLLVDGEVIMRHYTNWPGNNERYGVQFIDPRLLDVTFNRAAENGQNPVVMGIEKDGFGAPLRYYFKKSLTKTTGLQTRETELDAVPADQITHIFLPEFVVQTRGVPPIIVGLLRMNMLKGYEEAELIAARAAASKLGFIERDQETAGEYQGDDEDEDGNVIVESEPGSWTELPAGYRANMVDPNHPVDAYEKFVRQVLRGLASGLNISYNSLANDLVGVSWSSLRKADLEERDNWRCLQQLLATHLLDEIFERWLVNALENQVIITPSGGPIEGRRAAKLKAVTWQARGWDWVDPVKQQQANLIMINTNQVSVGQLIRESGRDPAVVFEEIAEDKRIMDELGITTEDVMPAIQPEDDKEEDVD